MPEEPLLRRNRTRAGVLAAVTLLALGASSFAAAAPNPDPRPPAPPAPAAPPPPPPAYVPPPPPPPAYVPPPPPAAYTPAPKPLDHRAKRSTEKAIADPAPTPEIQATGRLTFAVARTAQNTEHRRSIAASEPAGVDTRSSVVTLLLAIGLGFALLALLLPLARPMLPGQLGVLVHERRDSFIVGAGACVVGIALGVMVASMGS